MGSKDFKDQLKKEAEKIGRAPTESKPHQPAPPRGGQYATGSPARPPVYQPPAGGYFEDPAEAGPLKPFYVSKSTLDPLARTLRRDNLTMHQLRRFYNYCCNIRQRLRSQESTWGHERVNVEMLSAHAANAAGKKYDRIPDCFRDFFDINVAMIHTERDFRDGFMKHFEALVGFSSLYLRDR